MIRICCIFGVFCGLLIMLQGCTAGNRYTYGYYTGKTRPASAAFNAAPVTQQAQIHVVQKGDTLYSIAFACGEDVRTVASWNHLRPPYTIYPNQVLRLTAPPPPVNTNRQSRGAVSPPRTQVSHKSDAQIARATPAKSSKPQKISWQWPTNGKIIGTYSVRDVGKKGLDIAGRSGQPIYAAASGTVVYSGNGLRGYGQLIIIKHNDTFFSAYAHNRKILVKEDQKVNKGQHIADMGSTEADRPQLHFEVRRDGKPVDPLRYLPRRH